EETLYLFTKRCGGDSDGQSQQSKQRASVVSTSTPQPNRPCVTQARRSGKAQADNVVGEETILGDDLSTWPSATLNKAPLTRTLLGDDLSTWLSPSRNKVTHVGGLGQQSNSSSQRDTQQQREARKRCASD
ncbi:unnamed protein product, partial [Ectocarpus sp. 13 AM-2016]